MSICSQAPTRTGSFPQWLASPTEEFCMIPVEDKQIPCCQTLLKIIPRMSTTGPMIFSSPALPSLFSILMSKTTNYSVSHARFSGVAPSTSFSLRPHMQAGASACQVSLLCVCGSHTLLSLPSHAHHLQDCSCCFLTCLPVPSFAPSPSRPPAPHHSLHWSQGELWKMWIGVYQPFPSTSTSPHSVKPFGGSPLPTFLLTTLGPSVAHSPPVSCPHTALPQTPWDHCSVPPPSPPRALVSLHANWQ